MQRKVRMSRKNTVKHNYRKGVFVISIVLLILCAALFVKYHSLSQQAQANEEEIALLEDKKQEEENRTQQLQKQEAYQQTDGRVCRTSWPSARITR